MRPRLVSSVVVKKGDKLLLVKEKQNDGKEWWSFPGGGVEFGETAEQAAKREIKEELGIDVSINDFICFKEVIYPEHDYHSVVFFFLAEPLNHEIRTPEEILETGYFNPNEAKNLNLIQSSIHVLEEMIKRKMI